MDKNDGKIIFTYDGPEEDIADDERSFVFFEKSGKWYFYIHNNKVKITARIINVQVYTMPKQEIWTIH